MKDILKRLIYGFGYLFSGVIVLILGFPFSPILWLIMIATLPVMIFRFLSGGKFDLEICLSPACKFIEINEFLGEEIRRTTKIRECK